LFILSVHSPTETKIESGYGLLPYFFATDVCSFLVFILRLRRK